MTTVYDPDVLARIRHLYLRARVLTDTTLYGPHRSRRVGQAVEFADYQEYRPGMSLGRVDWRVWARTDRYVVRRQELETEMPSLVVLDLSPDASTGSKDAAGLPDLESTKAGRGLVLAATILFWLQRRGERVGLALLGVAGGPRFFPPRSNRQHLQRLFSELAAAKPEGHGNLSKGLSQVARRIRRKSLLMCITDGMEEPTEWLPALVALAGRGTDLRLMHLFDEEELALQESTSAVFYSPEGGAAHAVDPEGVREAFRDEVEQFFVEVGTGVLKAGGQYIRCGLQQPVELCLRRLASGGSSPAEAP